MIYRHSLYLLLLLESRISEVGYQVIYSGVVGMGLKQLLITAFILVLIQAWCCNGCWEDERLALLQLHTSFNFSNSYKINQFESHWGKSANCCDWTGIECDALTWRVAKLDLSDARSSDSGVWYLNASLFLPFKQLTYLNLGFNGIIGCLQNEGFERLKILNNLEYLDLSRNYFDNNILSSLSGLLTLKSLNISINRLKGSIYFEDFNNLKNLKELRMGYNEIEELIFFKGGKLRLNNLETLDMSYNQLIGSFNVTMLAALGNLELLSLSGNKNLSEFVASKDVRTPTHLKILYLDDMATNGMSLLLKSLRAHFSYLKTLSLTGNNFIEATFSYGSHSLRNVENLDLSYSVVDENFLHSLGALPSLKSLSYTRGLGLDNLQGLCNLNYLQSLSLRWNYFNGELPWCLANLTSLQTLDLSGNNFNSTLPWWLANLTSLQHLDLSSNSLVGNLSSSPFTLMTSIQYLDLGGNNFQIPISLVPFYNYSNLTYLDIQGNELYAEIEWHNLIPKFQLEELRMSGNGWGGCFSRFLYSQHNLQRVNMRDNKMRGEFPHWLLENNTRLEYLDLSNNSLTGTIKLPSHSHMTLNRLDISSNSFSGQIPAKLGSYFPWLAYLEMSNNRFNGSIPSSIGNLMQLEELDLSDNEFNGVIPSSIGNLMQLYKLDLSNNHLFGEMPKSLTMNCLKLQTLKLSNNSLQGHVFPKNMNLKELRYVAMGGNQFIGTIPDSLYNCTELSVLDFNNNHLFGEIPSWLGSMEFLENLDLSGNSISGNIPTFSSASSLKQVYMSKNMLHGSFLHAFYNCSELRTLDLSHNFLTEDISRWNGSFALLSFLLVGHNMLEGEIPSELCSLSRLYFIDLSNNNLSGHIPSCLMYYSNWYRDSHPQEPLLGTPQNISRIHQKPLEITTKNNLLSYKGMILALLSGIDLSCNNLSGQIPPQFGNLNQIKMLNLSHNRLTGLIPATFSNLDQIESLDLSYNKLQGSFPPQITQLPFISSFSVAHNNLSGRTPERIKQFGTFDNDSYEGNPFLCGEPLSRSCTPKAPSAMPTPTPSNEEESGFIDVEFFYVSFIVTYTIVLSGIAAILYINPYWRRAWFYFVERKMEDCYYFVVYDCPRFFKFRA